MAEKKRFHLMPQVMILFALSVLVTGIITFVTENTLSEAAIRNDTESMAAKIAAESVAAIREYPAYERLLAYWQDHADTLDIEYDADFTSGAITEAKCELFAKRFPDVQLRYLTAEQFDALPEEYKKLCAEITYSWLITRLNEIKRACEVDYLYCVAADESYTTQFFLLSAADEGAKRGVSYEEVYPLGNLVTVGEDQQKAMRCARENASHLANAGDYVDYYVYFGGSGDRQVFIGMTYNLSGIRASSESQARRETLYAMLFQVFLSIVSLLLVYRFVLRPLKRVQKNIRLYKKTKDSAAITENLKKITSHNEIGDLSRDVSALAVEMEDYIGKMAAITAEKERISTELGLATKIQSAMMPHIFPPFPGRDEFDIYASMDPAKAVGGDFYDFFLVDDDHLCMVMADVSGKGVPAALFMMAAKIILQSCAMLGGSPAEILTKTNEAICSNNQEQMFVTVWLGILEISTGRLTAANAGHEYPVLQKSPGGAFELVKDKRGFVIGGLAGMRYREYSMELKPGAKLFLYTDGVPEATDGDGNMFELDRMLAALDNEPGASPKGLLENVRGAVDGFVKDAEQFDDLTMLCLEYLGKREDSLIVEAAAENLDKVQGYIEKRLTDMGFSDDALSDVALAAEEAFINIASYAYAPGTGDAKVKITMEDAPKRAVIAFSDGGVPFDPLKKEDPDVTQPGSERRPGGLGVFLIKKLMDGVRYEYRGGENVLTMIKYFDPEEKSREKTVS